jgi:Transmembrane domain of unknown function (DUF3566)
MDPFHPASTERAPRSDSASPVARSSRREPAAERARSERAHSTGSLSSEGGAARTGDRDARPQPAQSRASLGDAGGHGEAPPHVDRATRTRETGGGAERPRRGQRVARSGRQTGPRPRPLVRRVKRTVKHVDPLSVLRLSMFFYAVFLLLWMGIVAIGYWFISNLGLFDTIESLGRSFALSGFKHLDITLFVVEKYAFFVGVAVSVVGCLMNLFMALLYNVAGDSIGGVSLTFVEKEL